MAARDTGNKLSSFTLRTRGLRLLFSAVTCAVLSSAAGRAEAGRARFQLRLGSQRRDSQCLRLHEEGKLVGVDFPVHIEGILFNAKGLWLSLSVVVLAVLVIWQ